MVLFTFQSGFTRFQQFSESTRVNLRENYVRLSTCKKFRITGSFRSETPPRTVTNFAGTMKKAKLRRKGSSAIQTVAEDDGTQVERDTRRSKTPRRRLSTANVDPAAFKAALKDFTTNTVKLGVTGVIGEFNNLRIATQPIGSKPKTAFDAHADKNRYKDVFCVDASRVELKFPPGADDYIHANWVNGADGQRKFICTQGPKSNTVEDFWRMVWQEKCKSIVMLCNEMECGKKKCEIYWPTGDKPLELPCKLTVKFIKTEDIEKHLTSTKLEITDGENRHPLEHIQWKDWPDRGVPETSLSVFRLLTRVNKATPCVVHCSAGIGRTGTIVGLDIFNSKLEKGEKATLEQVVRELREVRHGSVQTDVQYAFMHRIVMAVAENKRAIAATDIEKFVADYDAMLKTKGCC